MTRDEVVAAFERIRVWSRGDRRAPHKPLLILLMLGRLQQGQGEAVRFVDIEPELNALLLEFGPAGSNKARNYPFWHLASDEGGGIWTLTGPTSILDRPAGATPTLGELRRHQVSGQLSANLKEALVRDLNLTSEVARRILAAHFPDSLHQDIADAVQLDLEPSAAHSSTAEPPRRRSPNFRHRILRAYEYQCCVCGHDLRLGQLSVGLEAAHIKWFQAGGPDEEPNGLALCALHHRLFDLGVFTVSPESLQIQFSQSANASGKTRDRILAHHGAGLIRPQSRQFDPDEEFLEWHRGQVFKRPARALCD